MVAPRIRALALCIFHRNGRILVHEFQDAVKQQTVFRPIGGGIEFGEHSAEAIVREVQEELAQPIHSLRLLGTLEIAQERSFAGLTLTSVVREKARHHRGSVQ